MAPIVGAIFFAMPSLRFLAFLMGLCPYILPIRHYPAASFWLEWTAGMLMLTGIGLLCAQLVVRNGPGRAWRLHWPMASMVPLILIAAIVLQLLSGRIENRSDVPVALAILGACTLFMVALHNRLDAPEAGDAFLKAYGWGLLSAQAIGLAVVLLEMNGVALSWGQYQFREPAGRLGGLFGQSNQLAVFAVLAWVGGMYVSPRLSLWVLISLSAAITLAAANSRIGYICLLWAVLITYVYQKNRAGAADFRKKLYLGVAIHALVAVLWNGLGDIGTGSAPVQRLVLTGSYTDRLGIWADSLKLSLIHPLTGVGFGDFAGARLFLLSGPLENPNTHHAHLILLHLAAEMGWPVALLVSLLLLYLVVAGIRALVRPEASRSDLLWVSLASVLMIYSLTEFPLWYVQFLLPLCIALALRGPVLFSIPVKLSKSAIGIAGGCYVLALMVFALMTYNYHLIQSTYMDIAVRTQDGENAHLRYSDLKFMEVPEEAAMRLSALPYFRKYSESLLARSLENDGAMTDFKLSVLRHVVVTDVNDESVARLIIFSAGNGHADDACTVLRSANRAPELGRAVAVRLRRAGDYDRAIADFLRQGCPSAANH